MENFKASLIKFLKRENLSKNEEELLVLEIKKIVFWASKNPDISEGAKDIYSVEDLQEEILSETFCKLIEKRNIILSAIDKGANVKAYLKGLIIHSTVDKLRKKNLKTVELNQNLETEMKTEKDKLLLIEAEEFAKISLNNLSKAEREALCLELLGKGSSKSKAAFEKAKSRARKRLKNFVLEYKFSSVVVEIALRVFMSELCKKFVNIYR